ncbi:hypothetical protein RSAG8_01463, partial [Rhizoctonia solani AG-8 WAC10335]
MCRTDLIPVARLEYTQDPSIHNRRGTGPTSVGATRWFGT